MSEPTEEQLLGVRVAAEIAGHLFDALQKNRVPPMMAVLSLYTAFTSAEHQLLQQYDPEFVALYQSIRALIDEDTAAIAAESEVNQELRQS